MLHTRSAFFFFIQTASSTTNFYIFKKIKVYELLVTRISRGIAVGSELQYADELTLGRSLQQRQIFDLQQ